LAGQANPTLTPDRRRETGWHGGLETGKGAVAGEVDDQIVLRRDAMRADKAFDGVARPHVVLGVSPTVADLAAYAEAIAAARPVAIRWVTWQDLSKIPGHPAGEEFRRYLARKQRLAGLAAHAPRQRRGPERALPNRA
jgi:hypothetical protein